MSVCEQKAHWTRLRRVSGCQHGQRLTGPSAASSPEAPLLRSHSVSPEWTYRQGPAAPGPQACVQLPCAPRRGVLAHAGGFCVAAPVTAQQHTRCQLLSSRSVYRSHPGGCEEVHVALKGAPYRLPMGTFTCVRAQQGSAPHALWPCLHTPWALDPPDTCAHAVPALGAHSNSGGLGRPGFSSATRVSGSDVQYLNYLICKINILRTFYI